LWNEKSGESGHVLTGHSDEVRSIAYSPQGHQIASASFDKTVRLWDVATGDCCKTLNGYTGEVLSVMYSPDGKQIATSSWDWTIRFWDVEDGSFHRTLIGHEGGIYSVAYSPQGNQFASGSDDMTVRIWDVESGECCFILIGHSDWVRCVAYSPKGDLLASGSHDKTVRLWGTVAGQCRVVIRNFQDAVGAIDWNTTLDVIYLVTGCFDGSVLKWQVVEKAGECSVQLEWSVTNGTLTMAGASLRDVHGLTQINRQLLRQRGAVGEPEHALREASKKAMTMAPVVSELKQASNDVVQDPSSCTCNDIS
jgi:WD40 repeat protein